MPGGEKKKLSRKKVRNLSKSPHFTVQGDTVIIDVHDQVFSKYSM